MVLKPLRGVQHLRRFKKNLGNVAFFSAYNFFALKFSNDLKFICSDANTLFITGRSLMSERKAEGNWNFLRKYAEAF